MMGPLRRAAFLGTAIGVSGMALSMLPAVLELEETAGLGWLFTIRGPAEPPGEVVVVSISGESADALGLTSEVDEWPRSLHGDLIDRLTAAGAAVIAFDIIFDQPRSADDDVRLTEAVRGAGNVILLERVLTEVIEPEGTSGLGGGVVERRVPPIEPLERAALATAPFTLPVVPIRVSQFWTFGRAAGDTPTLPAVSLHAYALPVHDLFLRMIADARPDLAPRLEGLANRVNESGLEEAVRTLRGIFVADGLLAGDLLARAEETRRSAEHEELIRALIALYAGGDSRYLNYYGAARTLTTVPYHRVVSKSADTELEKAVAGKVVFVGFSERRQPEQQDAFFSVFSERSGQNLSGVEIAATAFGNLLHGDSVEPLSMPVHWLVVLAWGIAIGGLCVAVPALAALPAALGAGLLYAAGVGYLFQAHGVWAPLSVPVTMQLPAALVAALLWNFQRVRQQRERIHAALGYYLPAPVVNRLAHETVAAQSNRELIFGTCLVTDAEQYTTLSESLHPEELGELMNAYYDVLVEAVAGHGGLVSDIAGDSMVAVWPAAKAIGRTQAEACAAAVDVLSAVDRFNRSRVKRELPTRLGLDSGQLLLGNIGSKFRGEYRAVGDIVNTAARLQGLNRHLGTRILLSGSTANGADGLVTRNVGEFLLLGKQTPVAVLELQYFGDAPGFVTELNERFAAALRHFSAGRWRDAARGFEAVLERFPQDGPSRFYVDQCRKRGDRGPEKAWDGVVRMTVK